MSTIMKVAVTANMAIRQTVERGWSAAEVVGQPCG